MVWSNRSCLWYLSKDRHSKAGQSLASTYTEDTNRFGNIKTERRNYIRALLLLSSLSPDGKED